jgi:cytosine/adenosine deaminase-related metal-dependent hydrolase
MKVIAAPWVLTGRPPSAGSKEAKLPPAIADGAVALDNGRVVAVGPRTEVEGRHGPGERLDAVILPALTNAHTHLELSHLAGRIPGGDGLAAWVERLVALRAREGDDGADVAIADAIEALQRAGVAAVGDVSNTLAPLSPLAWSGFAGTVFHEVFGFSEERAQKALAEAQAAREMAPTGTTGLWVALSPHAVYSTHPGTIASLLRGGPASIHLAEDPGERIFCATGQGPFAALARKLGATDRDLKAVARSAVARVASWLGPRSLAVHLVDLDDQDLRDLRRSGATAVLCPRSNRHIVGRLPDLPRLLAAGVPLAVGSDSLASSPSLSPLAELAALRRAFPQIEPGRFLPLAWNGAAVGLKGMGRLAPGSSPGILAAPLGGSRPPEPFAWLLDVFGAEERPFDWLAHYRPEVR